MLSGLGVERKRCRLSDEKKECDGYRIEFFFSEKRRHSIIDLVSVARGILLREGLGLTGKVMLN